jgi:hypothetical protein
MSGSTLNRLHDVNRSAWVYSEEDMALVNCAGGRLVGDCEVIDLEGFKDCFNIQMETRI